MLDAILLPWQPVPRYEALYNVSGEGGIQSLPRRTRQGMRGGGYLKPWVQSAGYLAVSLWDGLGHKRKFYVHHVVASAFIGPRPTGLEVRHLDGDPANNAAWNLAYGTRSENMQDMVRHGRHFRANQTHCIHDHEFTPENTYVAPGTRNRQCRICHAAAMERFVQRSAAKLTVALK